MAFDVVAKYKLLFQDLASKGLLGVATSAQKVVQKLGSVTGVMTRVGGAFVAISGAVATSKIVQVQREFDVLNSSLITAMGSTEAAAEKFKELNEFAANTPYTLAQSVNGFVKLKNLGLDPSLKTMRAYGDMASAMGKELNDMIEAVADASTFEFERLKEFGITSSQDSKKNIVTFTFQGKKKTIRRSAKEVQKYLLEVADKFKGAMETRMATLDGAFANFGLRFNNAFLKISQSGIGEALASVINSAAGYLTDFYNYLDSDEGKKKVASIVNTIKTAWGQLKSFVGPIISYIQTAFNNVIDYLIIVNAADKVKNAFITLGEQISNVVQMGQAITVWAIENQEALIALGVGIGTVVTAFGAWIAVTKTFTAVMMVAKLVMGGFATVLGFITAPITLIITSLAGAIALFTYFYRNNEKFRKFVNNSLDFLKEKFTATFSTISKFVGTVFDGLKTAFYSVVNFFIDGLNTIIRGVNAISSYIPNFGANLQMSEFEKLGVEHTVTANQAAESRALVAKNLINMTVEITGDVNGVDNFKANVSADGYKSLGGNNAFVIK